MAKIKLSKAKLAAIIIAVIIALLLIGGGIYCAVTDQNPKEAVISVVSTDDQKLIGKWESQTSPGLSAYVFYDNGTYDSYLSTVNFSGKYVVKGNNLTLINPETNREVKYKFKISGKVLTLTLLNESGSTDDTDISKYNSVKELNQKTLTDLIGDLAQDSEQTSEQPAEAEE